MEIVEAKLDDVLTVHTQIPEFFEPQVNKDWFATRLENTRHLILCAYSKNKPIGYLIAYDRYGDNSFYCWMTAVIPDYRENGVLTAMMKYLFAFARQKSYSKIKIKTRNDKREMLTYLTKFGFNFTLVEPRENIKDNRVYLEKSLVVVDN
jgi:GNAT superfamily N-acetyltransferase